MPLRPRCRFNDLSACSTGLNTDFASAGTSRGPSPLKVRGADSGPASWPKQPIRAEAVGPQPIMTPPSSRQVVKLPRVRIESPGTAPGTASTPQPAPLSVV